jgi:hypothetical protein
LQTPYAVMLRWVSPYEDESLIWTAWKNGKHSRAAGYGFRLSIGDRDQHFDAKWKTITIDLPHGDGFISVTVKVDGQAFWNRCCELRSVDIRQWMYRQRYAPWPDRLPPRFEVERLKDQHFKVIARV